MSESRPNYRQKLPILCPEVVLIISKRRPIYVQRPSKQCRRRVVDIMSKGRSYDVQKSTKLCPEIVQIIRLVTCVTNVHPIDFHQPKIRHYRPSARLWMSIRRPSDGGVFDPPFSAQADFFREKCTFVNLLLLVFWNDQD